MFPKPRADLKPNTLDFERLPLVKPTGFREYDARWLFPDDINLMGLNAIGAGLAQLADEISEHADNAAETFSNVNETLMSRIGGLRSGRSGGQRSKGNNARVKSASS